MVYVHCTYKCVIVSRKSPKLSLCHFVFARLDESYLLCLWISWDFRFLCSICVVHEMIWSVLEIFSVGKFTFCECDTRVLEFYWIIFYIKIFLRPNSMHAFSSFVQCTLQLHIEMQLIVCATQNLYAWKNWDQNISNLANKKNWNQQANANEKTNNKGKYMHVLNDITKQWVVRTIHVTYERVFVYSIHYQHSFSMQEFR